MFEVYIWPETGIFFPALNNIHFLRVFGKSLRNNAPPTILSSSPPWYFLQCHQHYSLSTLPTPPMLAHQPPYPRWHTTHIIHIRTSSWKQISLRHFLKSTSKILKIFTMRPFLVNFNLFLISNFKISKTHQDTFWS